MISMEPTEHPSALWSVHSPRESLQNVHDSPGADGVSPLYSQTAMRKPTVVLASQPPSWVTRGKARAKVACASWNS